MERAGSVSTAFESGSNEMKSRLLELPSPVLECDILPKLSTHQCAKINKTCRQLRRLCNTQVTTLTLRARAIDGTYILPSRLKSFPALKRLQIVSPTLFDDEDNGYFFPIDLVDWLHQHKQEMEGMQEVVCKLDYKPTRSYQPKPEFLRVLMECCPKAQIRMAVLTSDVSSVCPPRLHFSKSNFMVWLEGVEASEVPSEGIACQTYISIEEEDWQHVSKLVLPNHCPWENLSALLLTDVNLTECLKLIAWLPPLKRLSLQEGLMDWDEAANDDSYNYDVVDKMSQLEVLDLPNADGVEEATQTITSRLAIMKAPLKVLCIQSLPSMLFVYLGAFENLQMLILTSVPSDVPAPWWHKLGPVLASLPRLASLGVPGDMLLCGKIHPTVPLAPSPNLPAWASYPTIAAPQLRVLHFSEPPSGRSAVARSVAMVDPVMASMMGTAGTLSLQVLPLCQLFSGLKSCLLAPSELPLLHNCSTLTHLSLCAGMCCSNLVKPDDMEWLARLPALEVLEIEMDIHDDNWMKVCLNNGWRKQLPAEDVQSPQVWSERLRKRPKPNSSSPGSVVNNVVEPMEGQPAQHDWVDEESFGSWIMPHVKFLALGLHYGCGQQTLPSDFLLAMMQLVFPNLKDLQLEGLKSEGLSMMTVARHSSVQRLCLCNSHLPGTGPLQELVNDGAIQALACVGCSGLCGEHGCKIYSCIACREAFEEVCSRLPIWDKDRKPSGVWLNQMIMTKHRLSRHWLGPDELMTLSIDELLVTKPKWPSSDDDDTICNTVIFDHRCGCFDPCAFLEVVADISQSVSLELSESVPAEPVPAS